MPLPYASKTRKEIRQSIGYKLGAMFVGLVTSTGDTSSLIDTLEMAKGGTKDYVGREVLMLTATQSAIVGKRSFVASFDGAGDATIAPIFSAAITLADTYEMWEDFRIKQVEDLINQAIVAASDDIFKDKVDASSLVKEADKYAYDMPSGFVSLYKTEFEYSAKIDHLIHDGSTVWDELVDGDVTASVDTSLFDTNSLKLAIAAGAGAGDILATEDITSLDITDSDEVVAEVFTDTALDAGDFQILLDNTAQCASPVESLNIPAIAANTKTKIAISLADIPSDSAIISVGIKMIVDKGAMNFWIRNIRAQHSQSRIYHELSPEAWSIVQGSTPQLKLSEFGYRAIGLNKRLRLSGYQLPSEITSDTASADIDPDYIVAKVVGELYAIKGDNESLRQSSYWLAIAEARLRQGRTSIRENNRWVGR